MFLGAAYKCLLLKTHFYYNYYNIMAHFPIIQLLPKKPKKGEGLNKFDLDEDLLFLSETDYGGDAVDKEEKMRIIKHLKTEISSFATVNLVKKTLRFKKKNAVKQQWLRAINKQVKTFRKAVSEEDADLARYRLENGIAALTTGGLFYANGYCRKLSGILSGYLSGDLPQVLYIGDILDAHC